MQWNRVNVPSWLCKYIDTNRGLEPRHKYISDRVLEGKIKPVAESKDEVLNIVSYLREMTYYRRGDEKKVIEKWNELELLLKG